MVLRYAANKLCHLELVFELSKYDNKSLPPATLFYLHIALSFCSLVWKYKYCLHQENIHLLATSYLLQVIGLIQKSLRIWYNGTSSWVLNKLLKSLWFCFWFQDPFLYRKVNWSRKMIFLKHHQKFFIENWKIVQYFL